MTDTDSLMSPKQLAARYPAGRVSVAGREGAWRRLLARLHKSGGMLDAVDWRWDTSAWGQPASRMYDEDAVWRLLVRIDTPFTFQLREAYPERWKKATEAKKVAK